MKRNAFFFLLFLGTLYLLSSCALPRCKGRKCTVRMVHYHDGAEYRGVSLYKFKFVNSNPRYGEWYGEPKIDPSAASPKEKKGLLSKIGLKKKTS